MAVFRKYFWAASVCLSLNLCVFLKSCSATSVSTYSALSGAITDGALITVDADITFSDTITIANGVSVEITSTSGNTLSGGGLVRLFLVYGTLVASSITMTGGYVSTYGGLIYVLDGGFLSLDTVVLSDSTASTVSAVTVGSPACLLTHACLCARSLAGRCLYGAAPSQPPRPASPPTALLM